MNNSQFEQYQNIPAEKFAFSDKEVKLYDQKLDTKPTTFAKDSFRRFCKNKSSVVAAFILGIIILFAIFVPLFIHVDPLASSPAERFLEPKLFKAGTGFWDGTRKHTNIVYDVAGGVPAGYVESAVRNLVVDDHISYTNTASVYGNGGYVMFENQSRATPGNDAIKYLKSDLFTVTADGNYSVSIRFNDVEGVMDLILGEYLIALSTFEEVDSMGEDGVTRKVEQEVTRLTLRDWSTSYEDGTFNLSEAVAAAGETSFTGKLVFWLKPGENVNTYILIKDCIFSADDGADQSDLDMLGFTDATRMVTTAQDSLGQFPRGYWNCDGRKGVFESEVIYCSFVYDTYEAVYGLKEAIYAWSDFNKLIQAGLCAYDAEIGPESFVKLSDNCPIDSVVTQVNNKITGKPLQLVVNSWRYRDYGYSKMPKFIFGTDNHGKDVFSFMFDGLRTSLVLGLCTFAFCFMFGLVWGAISGYFGGWVDLSMERFCDILGGIPSMVVLTLCILHLGNGFPTFVLALCMTGWMGTAGLTRTQFYRFKHMEYTLASRTLGAKDLRLIFRHILPNSLGTIVTSAVLMIPSVIYSEASLAYLNLGLQGMSSFGVMLAENQAFINSHAYLIVIPSIVMALLMISFNLFGNGLRDAINPTLKGA